ncbi:hypothetical protein INT45_014139 [Circinella minor]|uniref:Uncharacterized protein n=1 Tax=Circinella minor TaxID=1195481 RepID=A0A8H7VJQ5_9FUNG|nr:hypothetical protein INT45_014139 [Circinella minor]
MDVKQAVVQMIKFMKKGEPEKAEPKDVTAKDNVSLTDYNVETDPPFDLTDDYHLLRNLDYSFEFMDDNNCYRFRLVYNNNEQEPLDTAKDEAVATISISTSTSANVSRNNAPMDNTSEMNLYHQNS